MPNPSYISQLSSLARRNSNSNEAEPVSKDFIPTFTRQPRNILPATTNLLHFAPPALPQEDISANEPGKESNPRSPRQEAGIPETRYELQARVGATTAHDLRYAYSMATTNLTNGELSNIAKASSTRIPLNRTFVDRGGSDTTRNILLRTLSNYPMSNPSSYMKSITLQMAGETPVNTNAILGIFHAGEKFFAKNGERFRGNYEQLRDYVPKVQVKSTDYLFNNPPTQAEYLIPKFDEILAANPQVMLPVDHMEQTKFKGLKLNHLIPPFELHHFLGERTSESEPEPEPHPAKRQRTDAPVFAPVAQTPLIAPAPQGVNGLSLPDPLGNVVHGGTTRSSTSDVVPIPQQRPNAQASDSDTDWNLLFNDIQKDWRTMLQPSSVPPFAPNVRATAPSTANTPPTLPANPSARTVSQEPAPTVAPSHWNGGQNQPFRQQASGQFADINASIKYLEELIKQNEVPLTQATSGNPQYQPSPLYASTQDPDNGFSRNAPLNSAPLADLTALQPDNSYNDLFALIESFPIMESGASTANSNSTLNQSSTYDNLSNPAVTTAPTGQLSNVWAPPTVAQAWNGGSTYAPQFVNPNQAYPQPSNQPQAPSQALVTMPGTYPTANSQFPTNFSNNPPFNSSLAPNPLAPSNSFHDYSRLLHQQQQPQPQQNMATPAFYSSAPINSYSAQQINQYNGPASNYFAMPATNYSFMPSNSMPATAIGTSAMPAAPANGVGSTGSTGSTAAPSAYPYQ